MTATKPCSSCKEEKAFDCFNLNRSRPFGLAPYCRQCVAKKRPPATEESRQAARERARIARARMSKNLGDAYVKARLRPKGEGRDFPVPDHLIQLEREKIVNQRLLRELRAAVDGKAFLSIRTVDDARRLLVEEIARMRDFPLTPSISIGLGVCIEELSRLITSIVNIEGFDQ